MRKIKFSEDFLKYVDEYQEFTNTTAVYPGRGTEKELLYLFLGLLGEEQEWYDSNYDTKEAGDMFWYTGMLCNVMGLSLSHLLQSIDEHSIRTRPNIHEAMKKFLRDNKSPYEALLNLMLVILESLIIRYYYSVNCFPIEDTLRDILEGNKEKLTSRLERNVLHGDGDNR